MKPRGFAAPQESDQKAGYYGAGLTDTIFLRQGLTVPYDESRADTISVSARFYLVRAERQTERRQGLQALPRR